jgi:dTMP kinase
VEGLDRAGKTIQVERLVETLNIRNKETVKMRFPDRSTLIGNQCGNYLAMVNDGSAELNDQVIHLLFAANRWEAAQKIRDTLQKGVNIVCDRYSYSGVAYSAAKQTKQLSLDWCFHPEIGLPAPDVVLFCEVSPEVAELRGGYGVEIYEKRDVQERVRAVFNQIIDNSIKIRERCPKDSPEWIRINCDRTIDEVHANIMEVVDHVMKNTNLDSPPNDLVAIEPKADSKDVTCKQSAPSETTDEKNDKL